MVAPATITVYDNLYAASGAAVSGATVNCVLNGTQETTAGGLISPTQQSTTTDGSGRFAFTVVCNDLLSPANSTYTIMTPFRTYDIAPQSANGASQQTTAANVIVNTPLALAPWSTITGPLTISGTLTVVGAMTAASLNVTAGEPGIDTTAAGALLIGDNNATSVEIGAPTSINAGGATGATLNAAGDLALRSITVGSSSPYVPVTTFNGLPTAGSAFFAGPYPWYSAAANGCKGDGVTEDTSAFQTNIINKAQVAGGVGFMEGPAIYIVNQLNITGALKLNGTYRGGTVVRAKTGATGPLINIVLGAPAPIHLEGFDIDMTNAPGIEALMINNTIYDYVRNIRIINGGTIGMHLVATSSSVFCFMLLNQQTSAGVLMQGDASAENRFEEIDIQRSAAGTMIAGFQVDRTGTADVGAYYLYGVKITRGTGTINSGFWFNETGGSPSQNPVFMSQCVADNINGTGAAYLFTKQQNVRMSNCWGTATAGTTVPTMRIDGGQDYQIGTGNFFQADTTGVCIDFINAPANIQIDGVRFNQGLVALNIPVSNPPTGLSLGRNFDTTTALTNSFARLALASTTRVIEGPVTILTHGGGGLLQMFALKDAVNGKLKNFRVNSSGHLEILNDAGNSVLLTLQDTGALVSASIVQGQEIVEATTLTTAVASQALNAANGNYQEFNITSNIAVVIQAPTNAPAANTSEELTVAFYNNSGGALTTPPTFAAGAGAFLLSAAAAAVASTLGITYKFRWAPNANGGARYREVARTVAF